MRITTQRLILREFEETDAEAVLAYHSDPLYLQYFPWTTRTREDVDFFVGRLITWGAVQPRTKFHLAVVLKSGNWVIGNCGIRLDAPDSLEGELGCEINPQYWGNGYATEALGAILSFGFGDLGLRRAWATCVAENIAAQRLVEKLGLQKEQHISQHRWMKDRWWDTLVYGIHQHEWPQEMAAQIAFLEDARHFAAQDTL